MTTAGIEAANAISAAGGSACVICSTWPRCLPSSIIPVMKAFYERLLAKGKLKKVALVAVMHKMLTRLNAMSVPAGLGTPITSASEPNSRHRPTLDESRLILNLMRFLGSAGGRFFVPA